MGGCRLVQRKRCSVDECERPSHARGLCNLHYKRWYKQQPSKLRGPRPASCRVVDCNRPVKVVGLALCAMHYGRWSRGRDLGNAELQRGYYPRRSSSGERIACGVAGCDRPCVSRGWCKPHYDRWIRTGSPESAPVVTVEDRFWAKVEKVGPVPVVKPSLGRCWIWTGAKVQGYGAFRAQGKNARAHRFAYELLVRPLAEWEHLDHLCCVPACVNPAHLEPVTLEENSRRANDRRRTAEPCPHCGRPWPRYV